VLSAQIKFSLFPKCTWESPGQKICKTPLKKKIFFFVPSSVKRNSTMYEFHPYASCPSFTLTQHELGNSDTTSRIWIRQPAVLTHVQHVPQSADWECVEHANWQPAIPIILDHSKPPFPINLGRQIRSSKTQLHWDKPLEPVSKVLVATRQRTDLFGLQRSDCNESNSGS
jgi:hypothetical protein